MWDNDSMIGVVGATGFTGRLIANELQNRAAKFLITGRNETALRSLASELGISQWKVMDVQNASSYGALDGCSVIINCAGPFLDFGEAIVKEAIKRNCHYLDLTGEQAFIKLVYDKYDSTAKAANVCLIPAFAFEYALGDAAASLLLTQFPEASQIEIVYYMEGKDNTSPGTRKSIIRAIAAPGFQLRDGKLINTAPAALVKSNDHHPGKTPISFPGGEVLMLPKHSSVKDVTTYMAIEIAPAAVRLVNLFGQNLLRLFGEFLVKNAGAQSPSLASREQSLFEIHLTASDKQRECSTKITGKDPYGLTAMIAVSAACFMESQVKQCQNLPYGAISPSMLAGPEFIKNICREQLVSWIQGSPS